MRRLVTFAVILLCCATAQAHHWVRDIYDASKRVTLEVEVKQFRLINPHPLLFVEITGIADDEEVDGVAIGQTWTLEMDNKRELTALGFHNETFIPGDTLLVVVDPSHNTLYRKNTLYLRAVEHRREGFVYLHNVRQLFPIEDDGENLSRHLHRIN
jgi:hypothetical protein